MSGLAEAVVVQDAQVLDVYRVRRGGVLASTLAPGSATLTIDDADQFVDGSGRLSVRAQDDVFVPADPVSGTLAYTDLPDSAPVEYVRVDRDTGVVTLAVPWDAAFPTFVPGDAVWVEPPSLDHRVDVALDGELAQTVTATVPHTLSAMLPEGTRMESAGEWVRVAVTATGYELIDVLGEAAFVDAGAVVTEDPTGDDAEFATVTADLIVSDSVPRRNELSATYYVDPVAGDDDNGGEALLPLLDTFERSVTGPGWGTSDSGHAWTALINQAVTLDVGVLTAGSARIRHNAAGANETIVRALGALDVEVLTRMNFNQLPTAGSYVAGVAFRIAEAQTCLAAVFEVSGTKIDVNIETQFNNVWTIDAESLNFRTGLTNAILAAEDYWIRARAVTNPDGGTDVFAKFWVEGSAEPEDWTLTWNEVGSGGLQSAGGVGAVARTGSAFTGNVSGQWRYLDANLLDGDGEAVDVTVGGVGPLATVAAALAKVGDWNDGAVRIVLAGIIEEDVELAGLGGGGQLTLDGAGVATLNGYVRVRSLAHLLTVQALTVQDTGNPGPSASIHVGQGSGYVLITRCNVQTNGYRSNVVQFAEGARGRVDNTGLHNATSRGLYAVNTAVVYADDNTGSTSPTSYQASCATIFVSGSKPSNATNTTLGGQILGSTSSNSGGSAPPPQPTKKTDSHTANGSQTWRPAWDWDNDKQPKQGEWQGSGGLSRGCAFYGTKLRKPGRQAVSGKVYIKRAGSGGMSGKQDIFLATHNLEKQPSGSTQPNIINGPSRVGALGYGEGAWFTIPKGWVQDLMTGPARGLMLYHGSANPYVIGQPAGGTNWKVQITHTP